MCQAGSTIDFNLTNVNRFYGIAGVGFEPSGYTWGVPKEYRAYRIVLAHIARPLRFLRKPETFLKTPKTRPLIH